jgi:hypothetical protein
MTIHSNHQTYIIRRSPSIFISRNGEDDVTILTEGGWGAKEQDGKRYHTAKILSAESGGVVRSYEALPREVEQAALEHCNQQCSFRI